MNARATGLVPMAKVLDVQRAIDFYALLGLSLRNTVKEQGKLLWAHVRCEGADLMFSLASDSSEVGPPGVVFYLYSPDLVALRDHLLKNGVKVSEITYPFYMTKGEICLTDPDGYTLLIGQAG